MKNSIMKIVAATTSIQDAKEKKGGWSAEFYSTCIGIAVSRQRMATERWPHHVIQYRTCQDRPPQAHLPMFSVEESLAIYGKGI